MNGQDNPRGRPPIRESPSTGRQFGQWLEAYGIWVWRLLVLVGAIGGPLVVYFLTVDNRLATVERGVSALDDHATKIESRVTRIEGQARDIEYRLENVEEDLGQLQEAVAVLDGKIDRIIIALASKGTVVESIPPEGEPEPAD